MEDHVIPTTIWSEITESSRKLHHRKAIDAKVSARNMKRAFWQARCLTTLEGWNDWSRDQGGMLMAMGAIADKKGHFSIPDDDAFYQAFRFLAPMMAQVLEVVEHGGRFELEEEQRFVDWLTDRTRPN